MKSASSGPADTLLWMSLVIVAGQGLFGFDAYGASGPVWVASNLAVGAAAIPLMVWVARRFAGLALRSGLVRSMATTLPLTLW